VPVRGKDLVDAIDLAAVSPCFDRESLADEIERWLDRRVVDFRLRIKVTRTRDGLSFVIALGDKPGERRDFDELPDDCAGERRMVALSVALAIDAVSPRAPRDSSPWLLLLADGLLGTSGSDRPTLGAGLGARVRVTPGFWPGIGFVATVATDQPVRDDLPARFDRSIVAVRVELCGLFPTSRTIEWSLCAESWLGSSTVAARGLDSPSTTAEFWAAADVTAEVQVRFTRGFGVHAGIDGMLALRSSRVDVLDSAGKPAASTDLPALGASFRIGPSAYF